MITGLLCSMLYLAITIQIISWSITSDRKIKCKFLHNSSKSYWTMPPSISSRLSISFFLSHHNPVIKITAITDLYFDVVYLEHLLSSSRRSRCVNFRKLRILCSILLLQFVSPLWIIFCLKIHQYIFKK
jgi:hypothetical protein